MSVDGTPLSLASLPQEDGDSLPRELVVLSHLRWVFVWQRPQHLISRLARGRPTWFVEEPVAVDGLSGPRLLTEQHGDVCRVWLEVPGPERHVCFSDPAAADYEAMLVALLGHQDDRVAWLYTPMALAAAQALEPQLVVYDVMDDLASFRGAPAELKLRQKQALSAADIVFTGGRSLQRAIAARRPDAYCFPSGVDTAHYRAAAQVRRPGSRKVAGYVGVIDERLDLGLVADLASSLPDWELRMVGPVLKLDPAELPSAPNITYVGPVDYADLPAVMSDFDVALMPFALNEATRSISPTKTLEYLAAGLPVVSTPVPDVVDSFGDLVDLQADGAAFAAACRRVADHCPRSRAAKAQGVLSWNSWDTIADGMADVIVAARHADRPGAEALPTPS
jgi:glycosyltransferase involved in cell wall biosynthesis